MEGAIVLRVNILERRWRYLVVSGVCSTVIIAIHVAKLLDRVKKNTL